MPPAGFEPAIPASERPQTHATDRAGSAVKCGLLLNRCRSWQHQVPEQYANI